MRIKRIEITGFKSFCDRTVMTFSDPVTGVVGPNGCGKSNVVDAIRWCMGEQSAKHLRGQAMADVIFAGSETREPAGMAEVALTFEDVGFNHETLQMALDKEEELDEVDAAARERRAPDGEGEEAKGEEAEAGGEEGAEDAGGPGSGPGPGPGNGDEVREEVREVLTERPPAIDYSQYSEVTIARRLFRDGTSGYFLNGTPCRLRDITDFFLGTGVGTKAYSIIEQGRIGMIVSARAQDRRHIIEEAAGITKFKTKKRAAERKLEQTRQNLLRVTDIVSELEKRMGSLRRQAQKAERYRRYRAEVRDIELWKASHKFLEYLAEETTIGAELEELSAKLEEVRGDFEKKDAELVAERADLGVEERRLAGLQEQIYELENRVKLTENKIQYQRREADELEERVSSAHGEIRSLEARREEARGDLERQQGELEELQRGVTGAEEEAGARNDDFEEARRLLTEAQQRLDGARSELASARADMARAESQRESFARRREEQNRRLERVRDETSGVNARIEELELRSRGLEGELAGLKQTRIDLGSRAEDLERRKVELEEQAHSGEAEVETLRTELHRRRSRLQSLTEIHDKYEGFARGTRAVMQNRTLVENGSGGIRGLVGDVVDAPEDLEVAVEAALGDNLGGILVGSQEVGQRAIEYLKESSAGRSTFVPVKTSPEIQVEDRSGQPSGGDGVLGPMTELVQFESGFDEVGRSLLSDTLVVDSLERAMSLHDAGYKQTLVTLDGDVVDGRGVVCGGSREAQGSSFLSQKREIRELEEIVAELERDLADATARFVSTKSELAQVGRALDGLKSETHDGELAMTRTEKDLAGSQEELERLRDRAARLNAEQLELEEALEALEREDKEMEELHRSASERIERFAGEESSLEADVASWGEKVEAASQALTEARVKVAQLGEKRASLEAAVLRLESTSRELAERVEKLETSISEDGRRARELRAEADKLEADLAGMGEERRRVAEELSEGRAAYEKRTSALEVMEHETRKLRQESEKLGADATQLEMKLTNLRVNREHLEESMAERYRVVLRKEVGAYHLRPQVGEEEEKLLAQRKKVVERMGADINLTAIDEFKEVSERHEFLSGQQQDLEDAVGQLERAIGKINRTSRRLFKETFDAVNERFSAMFPRLFRGGKAKLALTGETDDVLEKGVEIMAQPPGKKNTTVDQLSGGEKALTAVALLFAIFLIKPSPFCLLDEVDAPLDDANVDRYNEVLHEMTDRSQFIVITHNKRTMEIADRLYGVTMEEPGCSKLVSVNLNRIGDEQAA